MVSYADSGSIERSIGSSVGPVASVRLSVIAVLACTLCLMAVLPSARAVAAETGTPSERLRKLSPAALQGDREAVRKAAKAIVKLGPREFRGAPEMRSRLRSEALRGSSSAANAYGMMLQNGIGGEARPGEASSWYSRSSARGNVSASKNGAMVYALGWGVRRDTSRAIRMLSEVPVDQRVQTMLRISKAMLQPGREEPEPALTWLQRAVALYGGLDATRISFRIAELDASLDDEMRDWLRPLADKGNGAAAMMLASSLTAQGRPEDQPEALKLYLLAADKGIDGAYKALGNIISSGSSGSSTPILSLLEEKAQAGTTSAKLVLGDYYLFQSAETQGLRQKGLDYLQQAARDGNSEAQYKLAMMLLSSIDDADQRTLARAYLVLSAKGGNRMAGIAVAQLGGLPVQQAREIIAVKTQ